MNEAPQSNDPYWSRSASELLHVLDSTPTGLTREVANERLAREGANTVARDRPVFWPRILVRQLRLEQRRRAAGRGAVHPEPCGSMARFRPAACEHVHCAHPHHPRLCRDGGVAETLAVWNDWEHTQSRIH
jgi:hypothetical protein